MECICDSSQNKELCWVEGERGIRVSIYSGRLQSNKIICMRLPGAYTVSQIINLISASSLTHVIVDDAERIGVQVSKELSPNDLGVLAHQIQIPQIVLLREKLMPVGETGRLVPLVRSRGNVAHNVDLERYGRSRK